jgi:dienelactone hydrolase
MQTARKHFMDLRRSPRRLLTGLLATFGAFPLTGSLSAQTATPVDLAHFAYDRGAPLNVKLIAEKDRDGVTVQDITYVGSQGDTVPAYLVIPKGSGKFAAVIWGHWLMPGAANSNRTEFLNEAIALAPTGVVSLLIDAPEKRPGFKPTDDPAVVAQQVVDLRRGLDLLLSRSGVDAARIAYVGHSWDAGAGAILDATDKRLAAFVFMSGPQSQAKRVLSSPQMAELRKANDKAQVMEVEESLKAEAWTDPGSYASMLGPAPALFQYGQHDEKWVPLTLAKDYVAIASGPKTAEFYDADHALNDKARTDRDNFLRKTLKLAR